MIYDKPQDLKLRRLPTLGSLGDKKDSHQKSLSAEVESSDNSITINKTVSLIQSEAVSSVVPENEDYDIIIRDRYNLDDTGNERIFDLGKMPLIDGIPILTLPDEELIHSPVPSGNDTVIFNEAQADFKTPDPDEHTHSETSDEPEIIDISAIETDNEVPMLQYKENSSEPVKAELISVQAKNEKTSNKKEKKEKAKEKKELSHNSVRRGRKLKIASFFIMLYVGTAIAFTLPLRPTYSESEKRELTPFPSFGISALTSGDYFDDINTWFSDTFPYREKLTQVNTRLESFYGLQTVEVHGDSDIGDNIPDAPLVIPEAEPFTEPPADKPPVSEPPETSTEPNKETHDDKAEIEIQQLSAIVVAGDSAYEYYGYSEDVAIGFVSCVNQLKDLSKPTGNVYTMIIPTSMDITLDDDLRKEITSTANQKNALDLFNKSFQNCICVDGIYDTQRAHRDEYTYFRTDHHWTALGAYYAYEQFAHEKGVAPVPLSEYPVKSFSGFLGTFYSSSGQSPALKENPDTVTAYLPINNVDCSIVTHMGDGAMKWPVINDVSDFSSGMKYLTFIGGDNALTTITNKDNPNGGTCVVIKDSYGNAFVPFLIPHYKTIYVLDPRHYTDSLSDFCADKEIEDVVFLTNISATRNYIYLESLQNLVR